jgi:hypothetical protein
MNRICIIFVFGLAACANATVQDVGNGRKQITVTPPLGIDLVENGRFLVAETKMAIDIEAQKVCPNGYKEISRAYEDYGKEGKIMKLLIECNKNLIR